MYQKETARKFAEGRREAVDYDIKPYGGLSRVQRVAAGEPDPGGAINSGKFLDKVRSAESGGRNIPNPLGGTAGGVYQITDSTWAVVVLVVIALQVHFLCLLDHLLVSQWVLVAVISETEATVLSAQSHQLAVEKVLH